MCKSYRMKKKKYLLLRGEKKRQMKRNPMITDWKINIVKTPILHKFELQLQWNPNQYPKQIFLWNQKS